MLTGLACCHVHIIPALEMLTEENYTDCEAILGFITRALLKQTKYPQTCFPLQMYAIDLCEPWK